MSLPKSITIREVGPREGFQTHKAVISTEDKLRLIAALTRTNVSTIEVTSFVRPDRVPQMADAANLCSRLEKNSKTQFTALYLNKKGFITAEGFEQLSNEGWLYTAGSETFLKRNSNMSISESVDDVSSWLELFDEHAKKLRGLMISAAFGCNEEGGVKPKKILNLISKFNGEIKKTDHHLGEVCLADTVGWATPEEVKATVAEINSGFPEIEVSLHLHDTRGTGIANAYAGLQEGVKIFESSVGGIGGCPFAPGAAGNVATEDLVFMCERMGVLTGIDLEAYIEAVRLVEEILAESVPGKLCKAWNSLKKN